MPVVTEREFFHNFPRPRAGETQSDTLERGLRVLAFMKQVGLILAPELVSWDVEVIRGAARTAKILATRVSPGKGLHFLETALLLRAGTHFLPSHSIGHASKLAAAAHGRKQSGDRARPRERATPSVIAR
jgi:hypothetical protein